MFKTHIFSIFIYLFKYLDGSYTILIPSDNAFQRWHPIDWGFYPFSVPEFTESILRNHFLPMQRPLKLDEIKEINGERKFKTLGGETVTFKGKCNL